MRLLLDEHLPPAVADRLGAKGHDVVAVARRSELRGASDLVVLAAATSEDRILVTADIGDFMRLAGRLAATGEHHPGIILVPTLSFPTSSRRIGRLVSAIDALGREAGHEALRDRVAWLVIPRRP